MEILFLLIGLVTALTVAAMSSARSYFEKGRRKGMEEAINELARGIGSHCQLENGELPAAIEKAIEALNAIPVTKAKRTSPGGKPTDPYHAQLWVLGDAIGEACWMKGHASGVRRKAPAEGKVRVDLTVSELLQLGWLAHLGFQHMMPNYRGFEIYRFSGEADAQEGARAVGRIEAAIPATERPVADLSVQYKARQKLINDWWNVRTQRATA